jgi:uncharacterized protein YfaS (alpha-2-macroglobulin family)
MVILMFSLVISGADAAGKGADMDLTKLWNEVYKAQGSGLPKTAIEKLDLILPRVLESGDYSDYLKAMCRKMVMEANIQGNKPEEKITRMEERIASSPAEVKPVLKLVLAQWYWHYYQRNMWRFSGRSATAGDENMDFTTWDLPRLVTHINSIYSEVLADSENLRNTPVDRYAGFFLSGNTPVSYRPTLFDLAAHSAIEFYINSDHLMKKPEESFEAAAESPILGTAAEFMAWEPVTSDTDSHKLKAINLYRELLKFHSGSDRREAFLSADLGRLNLARNIAYGEVLSDRFIERVTEIARGNSDLPIAADAYSAWANQIYSNGDYVKARKVAMECVSTLPKAPGTVNCRAVITRIEARELDLNSEYTVTPSVGELKISYRNIDSVSFRVVADRWDHVLDKSENSRWRSHSPVDMDDEDIRRLLEEEPVTSWTLPLEATADYRERTTMIQVPSLQPGFYRIIASAREDFQNSENAIRVATVWVTKIALVTRSRNGAVEGIVTDADTGAPLDGASVTFYEQNDKGWLNKCGTAVSDADGTFEWKKRSSDYWTVYPFVTWGDYSLFSPEGLYRGGSYSESSSSRTIFFTDRAIYRPGQIIHFKVLAMNADPAKDNYSFTAGKKLKIVFRDANYQEIGRLDVKTNDYGSASGTFNAPGPGSSTGAMSIRCENVSGSATVRVEEYKRPKFKVSLDSPEEQVSLNGDVTIKGLAMGYTGAAVDGARISYRVVREVRYPWWWGWWGRSANIGSSREITHGKALTDAEGKFQITFTAYPDNSIPRADDPTFIYTVHADVTDSAGETRSGQADVRVGYRSMDLNIAGPSAWDAGKDVKLTVAAATLNGVPLAASGKITLHRTEGPARPVRPVLSGWGGNWWRRSFDTSEKTVSIPVDNSNWRTWAAGAAVTSKQFKSDGKPSEVSFTCEPGVYKVIAITTDSRGVEVRSEFPVLVIDKGSRQFPAAIPSYFQADSNTVRVGDSFAATWGSGYETSRAFVEIEHRGRLVKRFWTDSKSTEQRINWAVTEEFRGGFTVHVTQISENRAHIYSNRVEVPWDNKDLKLSFSTFRSKLAPGEKEKWTVKVQGPDAHAAAAEMVAGLYDASLDAFCSHSWPGVKNLFRRDSSRFNQNFVNMPVNGYNYRTTWNDSTGSYEPTYWHFPSDVIEDFVNFAFPDTSRMMLRSMSKSKSMGFFDKEESFSSNDASAPMMEMDVQMEAAPAPSALAGMAGGAAPEKKKSESGNGGDGAAEKAEPEIDLTKVSARTNLNETAFFYPHLMTDADGNVTMEFTMPEALTEWRFMGFAHNTDFQSSYLEGRTVTQKELMVQPNAPRFLRQGDKILFTAKVTNLSEAMAKGQVLLSLFNAGTLEPVDTAFGNGAARKTFNIESGRSQGVEWELSVPDFTGILGYRVVASTGTFSDGEEASLPVLSSRILVTESMPLPVRGPAEKMFKFRKLLESASSDTLDHRALTLQMVSNPAWYAVQALPYLMEFPHECSEQTFNRLYANSLARHIANSNPKIRRIFDQWKNTDALKSNLEKNQDLKSVVLEETPWVRAAQSETAAKNRVGLLFDANHMEDVLKRTNDKLVAMQLSDGSWPWFPGGRSNFYITLYLMTGYGRLRHLGVEVPMDSALKCLNWLDGEIRERYEDLKRHNHLNRNNLGSTEAMYLYGRSFFLDKRAIDDRNREAVAYYLSQIPKYWLSGNSRLSQGHLALAAKRFADASISGLPVDSEVPSKIVASLRERSVDEEEMGMFWRETELSWWWYRAPIETQAVMVEVFDEIAKDEKSVEDMKVWLIKQKQTQDWKTTKATADAIYALLLRGDDLLASDKIVRVSLAGKEVKPEKVEAGTGFYEKKFIGGEIKAAMGEVKVIKEDKGVSWGSLHWQYMEEMSKVTSHATNLVLDKKLFVKRETPKGPVIEPISGILEVGDLITVRVILKSDRDMEYVHLKDYRGSGTEPTNVMSCYKYQDGLAYYESTRDTATHFFIDYLPKGTYVFEYTLRVQLRGRYQMGIAAIQCMYAPEFNSHSGSEYIEVK